MSWIGMSQDNIFDSGGSMICGDDNYLFCNITPILKRRNIDIDLSNQGSDKIRPALTVTDRKENSTAVFCFPYTEGYYSGCRYSNGLKVNSFSNTRNLNYQSGYLYFTADNDLFRVCVDSFSIVHLSNRKIRNLLVTDLTLFFIDDEEHLCMMDYNGKSLRTISEHPVKHYKVYGDHVYYLCNDDFVMYDLSSRKKNIYKNQAVLYTGFSIYKNRAFYYAPPHQDWYSLDGDKKTSEKNGYDFFITNPTEEGHWGNRRHPVDLMGHLSYDNTLVCYELTGKKAVYEVDLDTNAMIEMPFRYYQGLQFFDNMYMIDQHKIYIKSSGEMVDLDTVGIDEIINLSFE